jgi:hypothetical protein
MFVRLQVRMKNHFSSMDPIGRSDPVRTLAQGSRGGLHQEANFFGPLSRVNQSGE